MALNRLANAAVPKEVIHLLQKLMSDKHLEDFYLVGGTSLALRLGHRKSVDIDLFAHEGFDNEQISSILQDSYAATSLEKEINTIRAIIGDINVDFISHKYLLLEPIEQMSNIRMASLKDIAAMKINAISNRGSKKDFWDFAVLLTRFSTEDMLSFFHVKYPNANAWHAEKSLSFFDDAENDPDPLDLTGRSWNDVKRLIAQSLKI